MTDLLSDHLEDLDFDIEIPCERSKQFVARYGICSPPNPAYMIVIYGITCGCNKIKAVCQPCMNRFIHNKAKNASITCVDCGAKGQNFTTMRFEPL